MAESSVIREFLVGLGFKIDVDTQKKFTDGVEGATKKTEELDKAQVKAGKSALGMAAAFVGATAFVGARTVDFASKLENLHFAARRTGAAASSLKAVANAAQDVGVSADEAQASIEGVARYLRSNPAGESYLHSLGVQTRDANGHLRDTVDLVADIGREMAKQPTWLAQQRVAGLGISENFLLGMRDPEFQKSYDRAKRDYVSSGVDTANNSGHDLMSALRHLQSGFEGKVGTYGAFGIETGATLGGGLLTYYAGKSAVQAAVGKAIGAGAQQAATKAATAAAEVAAKTAAGAAASGAVGGAAAGRSAGFLARALPWAGRALGRLGSLGLLLHSEDLNTGEREYLRQRGAYGQPAPSGAPASPPVPAGQPAAANAPAGGTLAERLANSALGRLIARGEGGYSSVNRGARGGYAAGTEDLANMTLAEVMAAQRSGKFNAAGRYQIVRDTLAEAARALNLRGDEKFDQKLQDRIFGDYLIARKRRAISDFLSGKSSDLHAALLATSREWASVANPDTGRSYYDGVGKNHASITAKELENALRNSQSLFGPAGALAVAQRGAPHIEVHQDVRIEVSGASDPAATARAVANEQHAVTDKAFRYGGQLTYAFSE